MKSFLLQSGMLELICFLGLVDVGAALANSIRLKRLSSSRALADKGLSRNDACSMAFAFECGFPMPLSWRRNQAKQTKRHDPLSQRRRLVFERLEDRYLLSARPISL